MRYALAIVIPPLAMIVCGRMLQAILCGILFIASLVTLVFSIGIVGWVICAVWAVVVVWMSNPVRSNLEMMESMEQRPEGEPGHQT